MESGKLIVIRNGIGRWSYVFIDTRQKEPFKDLGKVIEAGNRCEARKDTNPEYHKSTPYIVNQLDFECGCVYMYVCQRVCFPKMANIPRAQRRSDVMERALRPINSPNGTLIGRLVGYCALAPL